MPTTDPQSRTVAQETYTFLNTPTRHTFEDLYSLYVASIVPRERKSKHQLREIVYRPDYKTFLAHRDNALVGFSILFLPSEESFCLLEYMAVAPALRNQGIGARLFRRTTETIAKERPGLPVVLEVDSDRESSPDQAMRRRRQAFYRRLGCLRIDGLAYLMPLSGKGPAPQMDLLVYSDRPLLELPRRTLEGWLRVIYQAVYACSRQDSRLTQMVRGLPDSIRCV